MKEILLTSTLPYWLVFLLVLGGFVALCFRGETAVKATCLYSRLPAACLPPLSSRFLFMP